MPAMNFTARQSLFILLWMVAGIVVVRHAQLQYIQSNGSMAPHHARGGTARIAGSTARKSLAATAVLADELSRTSIEEAPAAHEEGGFFDREMRGMVLGGLGGIALALVGMKAPGMAGPMMMKSMHRVEASALRVLARAPIQLTQINAAELGVPTAAIAAVSVARLPAGVLEESNRRRKEQLENVPVMPLPFSAPKPQSAVALENETVQMEAVQSDAEEVFLTELVVGNVYESVCDSSKWWKIKVTGTNADGSYFGVVDNAKATPWDEIWADNCRPCTSSKGSVVTKDAANLTSLNAEAVEHMMEEAVDGVVKSKTVASPSILIPNKEFKEVDWNAVENKTYGKISWMMA